MTTIRIAITPRTAMVALAVAAVAILLLAVPQVGSAQATAGDTHTVFLDIAALGRRDRAAERMNQLHGEMATQGYDFADMEIYTENGDLEGFFLTYRRRN